MGQVKRPRSWQKGRAAAKSAKKSVVPWRFKSGAGLVRASRIPNVVGRASLFAPDASRFSRPGQNVVNFKETGIPDGIICHLAYQYFRNCSASANTVDSTAQFFLNSIFSPLVAGGGTQPRYHDQLMALYSKSCVYACDWEVQFIGTGSCPVYQIGVFKSDNNTPPAPATPAALYYNRELSGCLAYGECMSDSGSNGSPKWSARGRVQIAEIFGISKDKIYEEDGYSALSNANPADAAYLTISVSSAPGDTGSAIGGLLRVRLVFHTKLYSRVENIAQS